MMILRLWQFGVAVMVGLTLGFCVVSGSHAQDDEETWPRELEGDRGKIVIYQPQVESFSGNTLESRAAISVTPTGGKTVFGAAWFKAQMSTDMDTRTALLESVEVTAAKFPDQDDALVKELTDYLEQEIPQWNITVSIDEVTAGLDASADDAAELKNEPPEVIYVEYPAVLVTIDGDPIMSDLENTDLKYVVNTPFYIVQDKSKKYYLRGQGQWFVSSSLEGEWQLATSLPQSVQSITQQIEEEEARQKAEQGEDTPDTDAPAEVGDSPTPKIIVRTHPTELLETDGDPAFAPIDGTNLLYMENTESDVIMDITTQEYFILISGRWYKSTSMTENNWTFVPNDKLPADFAKIPEESDMGQVLASVSGTQQAKEAVLENSIPQTAEVDRKTATVTVTYDGDPKFEKCGDNVAYAVNTDKSVLLVNDTYYCCNEAIWFVSKGPAGPWEVATEVPKEIQDIPPDCPAYNVKYVYVYDSTPDVVYVGYTPAYYGSYVYGGVVVYGTGWWYRPWWGAYYYPRPVTWGFGVHYNPVTGWGFSFGMSFGWLHIGFGRPWYGGWWGPAGYRHGYRHGYHRGYRHGYHRGARAGYRAGYRAGQRNSHKNMYKNPRGGNRNGVNRTGTAHASNRKQPRKSNQPNNVYANKNGQVQRNQGGNWQTHNNKTGSWSNSKGSTQSRDAQARNRSNQRSSQNRSAARNRGGGGRRR